ncbi:hypothetical protein MKS88_000784 [Plasmodium brasilianum]|uniref:Uncharacterized protein n=1 Tax=Plasmodium brasilianum TaxID=5824 RepID=A0ACB9YEW8_PLABR|nr:hypothetical protein MKS88_000784 [Plasmodium brasilianum]
MIELKIKLFIFIQITLFFLLMRICHLGNDERLVKTYLKENCKYIKKLNTITYGLLTRCKHCVDLNIVNLKKDIPINGMCKKTFSHIENEIFKELYYNDFLKNTKTIDKKTYKNIVRKKYGLLVSLHLLLCLLLLIVFIVDLSVGIAYKSVSIMSAIFYYDNKVKKYEKIKYEKR